MTTLQALFLGLIQGITEFFPISSSGHLVLFENLFQLQPEEHTFFNILVHAGTLLAILIYFRKDIIDILQGIFKLDKNYIRLATNIIISTIPIVIVGLTLEDQISQFFSKPQAVAAALGTTGLFFLLGEKLHNKKEDTLFFSPLKALLIGVVQSVAVIPGVSRSGSTLTAGLIGGIDRSKSAEYSFLIAIPAISGAVVLSVAKVFTESTQEALHIAPLLVGFLASFISGYISIKFLMNLYKKHSLKGFAAYLIIVSTCILLSTI